MFNKQNFCHVASNNRNEQKAGIFVYRTTDNLATVLASGYFNEKLVDINLHDIIIHEQTDNADKTKVQKNVLCVTERTLDNVGTTLVKSQWEEDIESAVESLQDDIETIQDDITDIKAKDTQQDGRLNSLEQNVAYKTTDFKTPITSTNKGITQTEETALNNKIDLAANSGRMITDQGVWYAKMYAATVAPSAENGTNYADFSQTDGQGNPIIVTYNRVNGAWVQDQTITPPAEYDGYVPITSKIWDITEQAGQQGGRILWNHQSKEFTPYPQIISFEDIEITGDSTVDMPQNPGANQIVNKDYVDEAIAGIPTGGANTDLSNLTATGANIGNWSANVSNCIIEIPQDIKLDLDNGILALRAGSKVYVPNGVGVFDTHTVASDVAISSTRAVSDGSVFVFWTNVGLQLRNISQVSSGPTEPTITPFSGWYDTTNNLVKLDSAGIAWQTATVSFPVAVVTVSSGVITSLDQVFNGFGYIGSTVFALPGVKGVIPNGKNENGTLKNTVFSINSIMTETYAYADTVYVLVNANGISLIGKSRQKIWYDSDKNTIYGVLLVSPYTKTIYKATIIGCLDMVSGQITSFESKQPFHAVDYSEADFVIESQLPTSANNYTWYRKYKSGWVEQGGYRNGKGAVSLLVNMANTYYTALIQSNTTGSGNHSYDLVAGSKTTSGFTILSQSTPGETLFWQVSGMSAN